ncbi:sensor histidine kinase, partial [Anoxybacillus sp. LAT_38]|nr:sensor histidine kinase [Anoxybacillus sp. LAT_38]
SDEIGRLARSIERMRERLVRQDEAQQAFLQDVSHELKTPVMVIRSYAQSILDGIYPRGDLQGSVQVIDSEAERLEK